MTETVADGSSKWAVNLISAFGRGETLALALQEAGFDVQILDFTDALGTEWDNGVGPFPVDKAALLPKQEQFLSEVRPLKRGLTFWLPDGPLELAGEMADFYAKEAPVQVLKGAPAAEFDKDWLRRFMKAWAAPFPWDAWVKQVPASAFPYQEKIGLIPFAKEDRVMSFERFRTLDYKYLACAILRDIQFEGPRITELEVESGRREAYRASQWIWCLSSQESDRVGVEVAQNLFSRGIRKAEWRWLSFQGRSDRGPWSTGFPEYSILLNDMHLPWAYTNMVILRWIDTDIFQVWIKVPATQVMNEDRRSEWAEEIRHHLTRRLPQAGWAIEVAEWSLCPHSPVFDLADYEGSIPSWKNWDWIAPETLERLDFGARFKREAQCYNRLIEWRDNEIKKQGARRDSALHAP